MIDLHVSRRIQQEGRCALVGFGVIGGFDGEGKRGL